MANLLHELEYRTLKSQLPSWRVDDNYSEWSPCGDRTEFPDGTQYRVKEKLEYVVTFNSRKDLATEDKTRAMARVAKLIEDGLEVSINKYTKTSVGVASWLVDNNIQFKLSGAEKWTNATYFGDSNQGAAIKFRKRPDTYFEVSVKAGIVQSTLTFDDVDELSKYLDRQLRTSDNNFVIARRAYGPNF